MSFCLAASVIPNQLANLLPLSRFSWAQKNITGLFIPGKHIAHITHANCTCPDSFAFDLNGNKYSLHPKKLVTRLSFDGCI